VAFLDLDNFKYVNDTFGHAAGDELLREAARRLSKCARESDTVARLGGDEFLLLLDDNNTGKGQPREIEVRQVGERIIKHFSKPFLVEGNELNITPSLGFAIYPKDGDDSNTIMRHADKAMYRSKNDGKNKYCFYSPEMTVNAKIRMDIESELRQALDREEFSLLYQPIIDSKSGTIVKAEALLRWNSANLGMITPDYFISIAEETALIIPIGEWVIKTACEQVKKWRDLGWSQISITVNVSASQLQSNSNLVETIRSCLKDYDLSSDAILLELTEGALMKETEDTIEIMNSLENMGIKLLIDDFGTGYASLSYLQRYNFDSIKIDRSYINSVLLSEQDANLVKAVIAMAKSLGMSVVSVGVESKGQVDFLLEQNCELIQGYYFSKPVQADEFVALLNKINRKNIEHESLKLMTGVA
jgi:diguanylate cyclase (GGDEF)-like protein